MSKAILVTGATGKQGGSVVDALLAEQADIEILAVTRNPNSASAQKLVEKSSKIKAIEGNLDDPAGIFANAKKATSLPIWGVFSVQVPMGGGASVDSEERQGKALVDEALKQDVKFFVYTSVDRGGDKSFDNPTNIPHFISKHNIEHHLVDSAKNSKMDWAILRPTAFFENFAPGFFSKFFVTAWKVGTRGKPIQCVSISDIGYFAAQMFLNPEKFKGQAISLAGDDLTLDQFIQLFKELAGKAPPTTFEFLVSAMLWMMKDAGLMFKWFGDEGYGANIQELKKMHPGLKDWRAWLEKDNQFAKY